MYRERRPHWALPLVAVLTAGMALGCDSETSTPTAVDHSGEPIAGLVVSTNALTALAGHSVPLKAEAVCAHGLSKGELDVVEWYVDDARLAVVDDHGELTALHSGTVTVTAKSMVFTGKLEIELLPFGETIGAEGGTLVSLDGGASIEVPVHGLGHHLPITLEVEFVELLGEAADLVVGEAYRFNTADPCHERFRMTVGYGEAPVPNAMEAPWFRLHRLEDGAWVELSDGEVDTDAKTVSAFIEHVGVYAILPAAAEIERVEVVPAATTLEIDGSADYVARAFDRFGIEHTDCEFFWTVSDAGVATISTTGHLTAVGLGAATVTATCEGVAGHGGLVVGSNVHSIVLDEAAITLVVGDTYALSAHPISKDGEGVARPLNWKSDDITIVRVDVTGMVTAMAVGRTKVRAESDGHWAKVFVTVVPKPVPVAFMRITPLKSTLLIGEEVQLTATFYDAGGNPVPGGPVTWSSLNPPVAGVDPDGLVEAFATGTAVIEAVSGPLSAKAEVMVVGPASMRVTPLVSEIDIGEEMHLKVEFFDARGEPMKGGPVTWESMDPEVMFVNENGVVAPLVVGLFGRIKAVSGHLSAMAEVFCRPEAGAP